jgi:DNA-binding CsgD family transcriptional regulator
MSTSAEIAGELDIADALSHLMALGPPSQIRDCGPAEAARTLNLDRVLLTGIAHGTLRADALYLANGPAEAEALGVLRTLKVVVRYPLTEAEIARRRRARLVRIQTDNPGGRHAFEDAMCWGDHLVAPIILGGRVDGFFHADRAQTARPLDDADAAALGTFALCFALVFERAVLRQRLRTQRHELRQVASWAEAQTSELADRSISLAEHLSGDETERHMHGPGREDPALRDLLTRRELDVLELMVRGETNGAIARELVLSDGTIKFHVRNILRKLHASNRAEATSRYLRLTLNRSAGDSRT